MRKNSNQLSLGLEPPCAARAESMLPSPPPGALKPSLAVLLDAANGKGSPGLRFYMRQPDGWVEVVPFYPEVPNALPDEVWRRLQGMKPGSTCVPGPKSGEKVNLRVVATGAEYEMENVDSVRVVWPARR